MKSKFLTILAVTIIPAVLAMGQTSPATVPSSADDSGANSSAAAAASPSPANGMIGIQHSGAGAVQGNIGSGVQTSSGGNVQLGAGDR